MMEECNIGVGAMRVVRGKPSLFASENRVRCSVQTILLLPYHSSIKTIQGTSRLITVINQSIEQLHPIRIKHRVRLRGMRDRPRGHLIENNWDAGCRTADTKAIRESVRGKTRQSEGEQEKKDEAVGRRTREETKLQKINSIQPGRTNCKTDHVEYTRVTDKSSATPHSMNGGGLWSRTCRVQPP